jgi:nucleotide-binding universal stress UspA family protein
MAYQKILIAVDDSPLAMKAARTGFDLAHALKASVAIVYVLDKSKVVINADLGITPEESKNILLQEANKTLLQFIRLYDGEEEVYRFTPEGDPTDQIIKTAEEWGADLIVIGSHGKTSMGRLLTGSLAEYVIRHAKVPVLITPPGMSRG